MRLVDIGASVGAPVKREAAAARHGKRAFALQTLATAVEYYLMRCAEVAAVSA